MSKKEITFNDLTSQKQIELIKVKNSSYYSKANDMFRDKTYFERYKSTNTIIHVFEVSMHIISALIVMYFAFMLAEGWPLWIRGLFAIVFCSFIEWSSHSTSWEAMISHYSPNRKFSWGWTGAALFIIAIQFFASFEAGKNTYAEQIGNVSLDIIETEEEKQLRDEIDSLSSVKATYEGTTWKGRITSSASKSLVSLNSILAMKEAQLNDLKAVSLSSSQTVLNEDKAQKDYFKMIMAGIMALIVFFIELCKAFRVNFYYQTLKEGLIVSDAKEEATIPKQGDTKPKQDKNETTPKQKQIGFGNQRTIEVNGEKFRVSENEKGQPIVEMNGSWKTKASIQGAKRSYKSRGKLDKVKIYEEIANKMNVV